MNVDGGWLHIEHVLCTYMYVTLCAAFVLAGDGTSHKKINYEASSLFLHAPDYDPEEPDKTVRSCRFLGVCATASHASAVQQASLEAIITEMVGLYNTVFGSNASPDEIYRKLTSTMGDHHSME